MKHLSLIVLVVVFLFSCTNQREADLGKIQKTEKETFDSLTGEINKVKAEELAVLYLAFAKEYQSDTLGASMYFKAAEIFMTLNKGKEAIDALDNLVKNYPTDELVANALHFKGFIFEEKLGDLDKAREAYLKVIELFPNTDLSANAQASIDNLGKSPEEVIKMFEEKQRIEDSLSKIGN